MPINEVFPNPTIKKVIFQIRYPNLFFIESKIGDFQMRIMRNFPESSLIFRKQLVFADIGPSARIEDFPTDDSGKKIWQFTSPIGVKLNISSDSLDISSEFHKSYRIGTENRFRDTIEGVLSPFLELVQLPTITRVGLRYIDNCPIPAMENNSFGAYYNSVFPLERFGLEDAEEILFRTIARRDNNFIRYSEFLSRDNEEKAWSYILDFDAFSPAIEAQDYLNVTDSLHELIEKEYLQTIKEPVFDYMRRRRE